MVCLDVHRVFTMVARARSTTIWPILALLKSCIVRGAGEIIFNASPPIFFFAGTGLICFQFDDFNVL